MNLEMMQCIDRQYLKTPFYGRRRMTHWLRTQGYRVNPKRVQRLMRLMGIEGIAPKPNLSRPSKPHTLYPYLLRGLTINRPNQVWSTDITYCAIEGGFMYLVAVIDWYSRYVLSWALSNTLETRFCLDALDNAFEQAKPDIVNTDQGSQFTSLEFTNALKDKGVLISMDGKGRAIDNVFVERLWRSFKYECLYLNRFTSVAELAKAIDDYFTFYNQERMHQSLGYQCPYQVHYA